MSRKEMTTESSKSRQSTSACHQGCLAVIDVSALCSTSGACNVGMYFWPFQRGWLSTGPISSKDTAITDRHPWSHFTHTTRRKAGNFFKGIPFVKINVPSHDALVVSTYVVVLFTLLVQ